jgi:hypothetical protein
MAKHLHIISGTTPRNPSRRDIAAGGIAMLVLAAAAAGVDKAEELDGELLQAAADFHRLRAKDKAAWATLPRDAAVERARWDWCNSEEGDWTLTDAATRRVSDLPARTPEGLRAKARVAQALLLEHHGSLIEEDAADEEIAVAMSLVQDILGRAGA